MLSVACFCCSRNRALGHYVWVIGQALGQDGWILAKFFFCVFMDRDEVEVHKHERGQYPAILTEQAWSIKDLLYGIKHPNMINYTFGITPVSRAGKIAPSCQLQREIRFTLPAHGARHIISFFIILSNRSQRTSKCGKTKKWHTRR